MQEKIFASSTVPVLAVVEAMPKNSKKMREMHPHLLGAGSNPELLPIYGSKKPGVSGPLAKLKLRLLKFPDTLFMRDLEKEGIRWVPICERENCFEPLVNWDFAVAEFRECLAHRYEISHQEAELMKYTHRKENMKTIRPSRDPKLQRLMRENRVKKVSEDIRGRLTYHLACAADSCENLIRYDQIRLGFSDKCEFCNRKYFVAGNRTRSKKMWDDRKIIVGWEYPPWQKKSKKPVCCCSIEGCSNTVFWQGSWTVEQKSNRKCRECLWQYGTQRPYEVLYKRFLDSSRQSKQRNEISYPEFVRLIDTQHCHYCGDYLDRTRRNEKGVKTSAYFLDRKDNHLPYTKNNVVACCSPCNYTKGPWISYEEMLVLGKLREGDRELAAKLCLFDPAKEKAHVNEIKALLHLRLAKLGRARGGQMYERLQPSAPARNLKSPQKRRPAQQMDLRID